jgi:hypothetical protein
MKKIKMFCIGLAMMISGMAGVSAASSTVIYRTGFEASEGYNPDFTLGGQRGWSFDGSGGNGLVTNYFPGLGQHAFIGFSPPLTTNDVSTTVWVPLNYNPVPPAPSIVKFSVTMELDASINGGDDEFRWAVYNQQVDRLFSVDFFMPTRTIYFDLQDQQPYNTGFSFNTEGQYDLTIYMDFGRNQWMALLNDFVIVNGQPITLTNSTPLDLGDIDAVWFINDPANPGDNYMIFDNYTVTAEAISSIPPVLEDQGISENGFYQFLVHGEIGVNYSVDVTSDFVHWESLGTFEDTNGTFLFEDTTSGPFSKGFYRVRSVTP